MIFIHVNVQNGIGEKSGMEEARVTEGTEGTESEKVKNLFTKNKNKKKVLRLSDKKKREKTIIQNCRICHSI